MFNLPVSAIKALDSLLAHIQEETVEPIEDSLKGARKNFKAGNYLAIATLFILSGTSIVLSYMFDCQYFIQSLIYLCKQNYVILKIFSIKFYVFYLFM